MLAAALLAVPVDPAGADPGDVDPGFAVNGVVTTDFGGADRAWGLALAPDGRILSAGQKNVFGAFDFALARHNLDGSLDPTLSGDGTLLVDLGGSDVATSVVLQPDGKIVMAGFTTAGGGAPPYNVAVVRLNADGSLDPGFDGDGIVITDTGASEGAYAVALQPDGKIVVAGFRTDGPDTDLLLVRYLPDGSLDATFGAAGVVVTDLGAVDLAWGLAIQPDGSILAGNRTTVGDTNDFALVRYLPDGSLDASFGAGGVVITDLGGNDILYGITLQGDGAVVVAGRTTVGGSSDVAVARYTAGGALDPTFAGGSGVSVIDLGGEDEGRSVLVEPDGRIVVAGFATFGSGITDTDVALVRLLPDGSLDATFGDAGWTTVDVGGDEVIFGLGRQADGKLVAAGWTDAGASQDFLLVRFLAAPAVVPQDPIDPDLLVEGATKVAVVGSDTAELATRDIVGTFPQPVRDGTFLVRPAGRNPAPLTVPGDSRCGEVTYDPAEGPSQLLDDTDADARLWPAGSTGEGLAALDASASSQLSFGSTAIDIGGGCIDIVRASAGPQALDPFAYEYYSYALDAVAVATTSIKAPSALSIQAVRDIYACAPEPPGVAGIDADGVVNNWAEVGGSPGPIVRTLPPVGSGNRTVFIASVLGGIPPASVPGCPDVVELAVDDGTRFLAPAQVGRYDDYIGVYSAGKWGFQANNSVNPTIDLRGGVRPIGIARSASQPCPGAPIGGMTADAVSAHLIRWDGAGYILDNANVICGVTATVTSDGFFDTSLAAAPGTFTPGMVGLTVRGGPVFDGTTIVSVSPTGDTATISPGAGSAGTSAVRIGISPVSEANPGITSPADVSLYPGVRELAHVVDLRSGDYDIARALIGFQPGTANKSPLCNGANASEILGNGFLDLPPKTSNGSPATTCRLR